MSSLRHIVPAFSDARGDITDIFEGVVHHTGIITFAAGAVRANHYHKEQTQYSYILDGTVECRTKDMHAADPTVQTTLMQKGDFVELPPLMAHAFKALTPASMLCLTTLMRDSTRYEDDTVRVEPF